MSHKELLSEVFCEVAENLAFMFGELAEEDEMPPAPPEGVCASMGFTGAFPGSLAMAVPVEMCREIAANVLGVDLDDPDIEVKPIDALKELLNVTCGHVLTALAGEEPVFDLTVPEVTEIDAAGWKKLVDAPGTVVFLVDESPLLLQLSVDQ